MISEELILHLKNLAEKFEIPSFMDQDPSQFLNFYKNREDIEAGSFIAAMLSFGNRKQFIPKIQQIFTLAEDSICQWLASEKFKEDFKSPDGNNSKKFYRFYSYDDMIIFFTELSRIIREYGSLGEYCKNQLEKKSAENQKNKSDSRLELSFLLTAAFPNSSIVPKGKNSANKRIHMFLRWMVRKNSPVDKGLWTWWPQENLLIPLDTHVLQEAKKMGLLEENASGSIKTALNLTDKLKIIWPEDPAKADFALFGLGVE